MVETSVDGKSILYILLIIVIRAEKTFRYDLDCSLLSSNLFVCGIHNAAEATPA